MKIPLKSIYYFESVARLGSYSKAAEEMFVTHAAVISQIKGLEQWMGKKLVHRNRNQLMLTEAGARFATQLTNPCAQLKSAVQANRNKAQVNKLVISSIPSLATCLLLPNIHYLKHHHPQLELELHYQLPDLAHNADIVLGFTDNTLNNDEEELFSGITIPVCGKSYAFRCRDFAPDRLNEYELLHDGDTQAWQRWYQRYAKVHQDRASRSTVNRGTVFSDFNMMRVAAINDNGIALCPKALIATELKTGALVQLSSLAGNRQRRYFLHINGENKQSKRLFTDWIMTIASSINSGIHS